MFRTIKSKFITLSLIVIILSIGIPFGFLLIQVSQNFHDRSVLMIETNIDLLTDGLNNSMMIGDKKNVQKVVEQISSNKSIKHIRIIDKQGIIKYANHSGEIGKSIEIIEPGHLEQNILGVVKREVYLDKKTNVYKAIQPILVEERCQSCHKDNLIISYLDVDTEFTKAEIKFYTGSYHMMFLGAVLILILALGFYLIFNKFINKPLNKIMLALDTVEGGNLDLRLPASGKDEFSILNYHYNRMVYELQYSRNKIDEMHFEQLQRADKMVTLGELTASMAHDVNNYVAIIMARADYLQIESENYSALQNYKEDFNVINDQINKIAKITGNILKHSKKLSKKFSEFNLIKLIDDIKVTLDPLIKKRNIILKCKTDYSQLRILGDKIQIEQAVLNIINNAIDVTKNNGIVELIITKTENSNPQMAIKDYGPGILNENLEKIYSPFFTTKSNGKGTGLGLYIAKKIFSNHNAEFICESKNNEGTTFIVTFVGEVNND
jgi:signal transduction histidine kinase